MLVISSEEHFKYLIELKDQLSVIMCWRPGCGFCDTLKSNLESVAAEYHDEPNAPIKFYTLDTYSDFIRAYVGGTLLPFSGVPSTIIYHNRTVLHNQTGSLTIDEVRSLCKIHLEAMYGTTTS